VTLDLKPHKQFNNRKNSSILLKANLYFELSELQNRNIHVVASFVQHNLLLRSENVYI